MPLYYKLSNRSKKPDITNPGKCQTSAVHHSLADQKYPTVHPFTYHRYPPVHVLSHLTYPVHPLNDPRYSPVHPLNDPRYSPVHPMNDPRYSPFHPQCAPRYPVIKRNLADSFTRRQFLHRLWAVEKSLDRRRQQSIQKNTSRHYSQIAEVQGQDIKRQVQGGTTNKVPTVGRQAARGDRTSQPEEACNWENSQPSLEPNSTDRSLSTLRPEHEVTEDNHAVRTCTPQQRAASTTSKIVMSSYRSCRLPSITYNDQSMIPQARKRTIHVAPVLLPRIYTLIPRPLQYREFLTSEKLPVPITDDVWEELKHCRYIRHAVFGDPPQGQR